jgi:CheY-like chemotaxis protein
MTRQRPCETIMVVNDDRSFIDIVGDALRAEGLAVLLVPGIPQALAALRSGFRPDALLLDVLPQAPVGELLEVVWSTPELRTVAVIATERHADHLAELSRGTPAAPLPRRADARGLAELLDEVCTRRAETASRGAARRAFP